eukprot:7327430-Ditylum_brightwellii.AAC.1
MTSIMTNTFNPMQQLKWFEERGVEFGNDVMLNGGGGGGGMVAHTEQVMNALEQSIMVNSSSSSTMMIDVCLGTKVTQIIRIPPQEVDENDNHEERYRIICSNNDTNNNNNDNEDYYDCIILATGSSFIGYHLAKSLGHTIVPPVRSMFGLLHSSSSSSSLTTTAADEKTSAVVSQQLFQAFTTKLNTKQMTTAPYCRLTFKIKAP